MGLGGVALVVVGVAFAVWISSTPSPKPATPIIPSPQAGGPPATAPELTPTTPSFDIVRVDPSGHAVIAGRAEPGAKVTVLDGDKPLGDVTADNRGEWVLVPIAPLSPGERRVTLEATDPKTGAKTKSADTVALAVAAPSAQGQGTVAVLLPGNANEPAKTLQTPNKGLSLDTAEYNDKGELMLSGHASPNATLRLYADNQPLATATADGEGKWSSVAPHPQDQGKVELRVDELGADGSVTRRIAESFAPSAATASGKYTVQAGNSLWVIARKAYGSGLHYTVIFGANKEHIKDPNVIFPGQVISLPKS